MLKKALQIISVLCLATAGLSPLAAQGDISLAADVKVVRSIEENGTTSQTLEEPEQVLPGDQLVFITSFANGGEQAVENFVITNPLPGAVALAENGDFLVSVDGGETYATLADLSVSAEDGSTRSAELGDVTHLRWTIATVAPGETGEVTYFAFVR